MNVKQLIEILQKLDPATRVLVDGYEDGLEDPRIHVGVRVSKADDPPWYYGDYNADPKGRIKAVVIGRMDETP